MCVKGKVGKWSWCVHEREGEEREVGVCVCVCVRGKVGRESW